MASERTAKPFRILKRDPKPDASRSSASNPRHEADAELLKVDRDALYQSARAEILGADFDKIETVESKVSPHLSPRGKAQYKGLDESQFDPDYVRVPPFVIGWSAPVGQPSLNAVDQYPSLSHAYNRHPAQPPSKP